MGFNSGFKGLKYSADALAENDGDDDDHHQHTNATIVVDIVTDEFDFRQCKRFRFSPKLSDCLCVLPILLLNGYRRFFPQAYKHPVCEAGRSPHLVPILRMHAATRMPTVFRINSWLAQEHINLCNLL